MTFVKFASEVVGSAAAATLLLAGIIKLLMKAQAPRILAGAHAGPGAQQSTNVR
jgi:hypothetical protein